jgi:hypothetical protein
VKAMAKDKIVNISVSQLLEDVEHKKRQNEL